MGEAKIVCFYSYKGGTGRSTALANVAAYLASKGKKVGCIDLDIESPGLNYIFKIEAQPDNITITDLLTKSILEYPEFIPKCVVNLKSSSTNIDDKDLEEKVHKLSGEIYLMQAAYEYSRIRSIDYAKRLVDNMRTIVDIFANSYGLEYIFLDSRSGVSSPSIMAQIISDIILFFFRVDRQGRKSLYRWLDDYDEYLDKREKTPFLHLIASSVPRVKIAGDTIKTIMDDLNRLYEGKRKIDYRLDRDTKLELEEEIVILKDIKLESDIKTQYEQLGEALLKYNR